MLHSLSCKISALRNNTLKLKSASLLVAGLMSSSVFMGCTTTDNENAESSLANKRATLTDLANSHQPTPLDEVAMTAAQRKVKLAAIYQQLLTLEPDTEVRTNVEYRLVQLNTETFESQAFGGDSELDAATETLTLAQLQQDEQALKKLILEYQSLLARYPNRSENEHIQYQLAKALDLQGSIDQSLFEMESLLQRYPNTIYTAELSFRRGEIYYNLQNYPAALSAYKQVINADNNDKYLVNSIYMSGWAQFKMNRLSAADNTFIKVFDAMIAASGNNSSSSEDFSFAQLGSRHQNLALDTQRVLSISLSQQVQSASLVALVKRNKASKYLPLYEHVLFENLANFLIKKELTPDAELTYQAYIDLNKNDIWSSRFSLALLDIYQRQGKFASMHTLKQHYVEQYGLHSHFWAQASIKQQDELLPNLLQFSDEHSRRLYAKAQEQAIGQLRISAFNDAAKALYTYLQLAKLPQAKTLLTKPIHQDEYLYAEANFEARKFVTALESYQAIAYPNYLGLQPIAGFDSVANLHPLANQTKNRTTDTIINSESDELIALRQQAAFATTVTIRELIKLRSSNPSLNNNGLKTETHGPSPRVVQRNRLDKMFISHYPNDGRALQIATHAVQYSFKAKDYFKVKQFTEFVLVKNQVLNQTQLIQATQVDKTTYQQPLFTESNINRSQLSVSALKQVQLVSQLNAHSLYQQQQYQAAEKAYSLALNYTDKKAQAWPEMRNLMASSIYFQAQALKVSQPLLAVEQLLRVSKAVPESSYAVTAEFDAINLLLAQQSWQQAVDVMKAFKRQYPSHKYTASIPAKLAQSYEALSEWELAAEQLLIIVANEQSIALKREAQYTAAEYYVKAGNTEKARLTFRTYASTYPEPFDIAQEVRFKMSEFYQQSNEPEKQYFWYRKMLSAHKQQTSELIQPRAIELASLAAFGLADAHHKTFTRVKLKAPLPTTLKRKQKAMKQAIGYYQQVLDFQLAQYVPKATYNLAEMYRQLAADVMGSERPTDLDELALEEYDILLEELAYPFEEKAIEIHISNSQRAWQDVFDQWVGKSFNKLAELSPALYNKQELTHDAIDAIH